MLGRGGGALDAHRAGLEIIRDACDGVILLLFFPPEIGVAKVVVEDEEEDDGGKKVTLSEESVNKMKSEGSGSKTRHNA